MRQELADAIQLKAETVSGVHKSNIYEGLPEKIISYPYIQFDGLEDDYELDSQNVHEPTRVQFSIRGQDKKELRTLVAAFQVVFDLVQLSMTNGWIAFGGARRLNNGTSIRTFNNVHERLIDYQFRIYKTR